MKKNGFTLAELLGVIIILGILMLLVVTPIINNINQHGAEIDKLTVDLLYSTTEAYIDENATNYRLYDGVEYYISVQQLVDSKLLEQKFLGKDSWKELDPRMQIKVTTENGNFNYELLESESYLNKTIKTVANSIASAEVTFDGSKYFSDNIANNYVKYGGLVWKIIGTNEDGSVRMILEEDITSLIFNDEVKSYKDSYVRRWLNEEFYSKIENNDIIVKSNFCADTAAATTATKSTCSTHVKDHVGLLSLYEINAGLNKEMLNNYSAFATNTFVSLNNFVFRMDVKTLDSAPSGYAQLVRPVININPSAYVISGNGQPTNPYILNKKIVYKAKKKLNEVDLPIGTHIQYGNTNNKYKVMEVTDEYIKLVTADVLKNSAGTYVSHVFSNSNQPFNFSEGVGYDLNYRYQFLLQSNDSRENVHLSNMVYLGNYTPFKSDYKLTSLKDVNVVFNSVYGLLKLGDIFAAPYCITSGCSKDYFLMTEQLADRVYVVKQNGALPTLPIEKNSPRNVRPTIVLPTSMYIKSGDGSLASPLKLTAIAS